jgi:5'-3' exonuclease
MTILIDGNNKLFREMNNIDNPKKSNPCHPIRSLWNNLSTNSDLTVIVWDGYNGNDRRKAVFPEYKGNRPEKGEDVYAIFKLFQELMTHSNCMQVKVDGWEADDVIYTLAKFFSNSGDTVTIDTNDADYLQMADLPGVSLPYVTKWAYDPTLICAYKALFGDKSDNIPGLKGFGEAGWRNMAVYHETIDDCLARADWAMWQTLPWPKLYQKLVMDKGNFDNVVKFYNLVRMLDVPIDDITKECKSGTLNLNAAEALMKRYML